MDKGIPVDCPPLASEKNKSGSNIKDQIYNFDKKDSFGLSINELLIVSWSILFLISSFMIYMLHPDGTMW
jgi:hypothetical protein